MQFHEKKLDSFNFTSFFAWTFLNFRRQQFWRQKWKQENGHFEQWIAYIFRPFQSAGMPENSENNQKLQFWATYQNTGVQRLHPLLDLCW